MLHLNRHMTQNNENTLKNFIDAVRGSEDLIKAYANKKCKKCLGRGKCTMFFGDLSPQEFLCDCVLACAKKAFLDE